MCGVVFEHYHHVASLTVCEHVTVLGTGVWALSTVYGHVTVLGCGDSVQSGHSV